MPSVSQLGKIGTDCSPLLLITIITDCLLAASKQTHNNVVPYSVLPPCLHSAQLAQLV